MSPVIGFARELDGHPEWPKEMFRYAWLEGTDGARLGYRADMPDWNKPDTWPAGRLFGKTGEYRWQRGAGNKIHTVLILEEDALPNDFNGQIALKKAGEDSALILWGEWVGPESNPDGGPLFYANEIPEVQTYPIRPEREKDQDKTPRLLVRRYRHEPRKDEKDQGEFIRCLGLEMRGEKEAKT